ncbi:hypothetical protein CEE82_12020, partial [Lactobacillus crispatus]
DLGSHHAGLTLSRSNIGTSHSARCWLAATMQEKPMHKIKLFAAAAALSAVITSPVLAQDSIQPRATIHHKAGVHHSYRGAYNSYNRYDNGYRDPGFWPGDVAAGIVGGAVGTAGAIAGGAVDTAGAIATAPFRT